MTRDLKLNFTFLRENTKIEARGIEGSWLYHETHQVPFKTLLNGHSSFLFCKFQKDFWKGS